MQAFDEPIYVTRPSLPPLADFVDGLEQIWDSRWLTNNGPLVRRLEDRLADRLNVAEALAFCNGTLALQIGLQALDLSGSVITTPFTFIATTHALFWNGLQPIFSDIDPTNLNLDPARIEEKITPQTTAILAVHVFGEPCDHEALADIARRHNLKLIYDAAHAFGVSTPAPIAQLGDMSMFSFHATKVFHTVEGGMLAFTVPDLRRRLGYLRNFGFESEVEVAMPGTNAKMNELQALMGLLMLDQLDEMIASQARIATSYHHSLNDIAGIVCSSPAPGVDGNHGYFPIRVTAAFGCTRDALYEALKEFNVFTRRYFYPLVCDHPCYRTVPMHDALPVARRVATEILALPMYPELSLDDTQRICDIIAHIHRRNVIGRGS